MQPFLFCLPISTCLTYQIQHFTVLFLVWLQIYVPICPFTYKTKPTEFLDNSFLLFYHFFFQQSEMSQLCIHLHSSEDLSTMSESELCSIFLNTWPPHIRTWPYGSLQNQTTKPRCARSLSLGKNTISYLDSALCFGGLKLPRIFLFLFFVLPEPPAWNAFQLFTLFCRDSWNKKLSNVINYQLHNEGPISWK